MLFTVNTILPVLALASLCSGKSMAWNKRNTNNKSDTSVSIYAYGGSTNGAPVFYDNGLAYIGFTGPDSTSTNVTFSVDTDDNTVPWTIAANTTTSPNSTAVFSGSPIFYIIPTSNSFEQAGFATNTSTAPTGAATSGFSWFGTSVAYAASDSDYEMMFWAVSTDTDGLWKLYWNSNGTDQTNATPITLKSTPPTTT